MSNVKITEIPFTDRYEKTYIIGKVISHNKLVGNLEAIFAYIQKMEGGENDKTYGKAARLIKKEARRLAGRRKYMISKRQVFSLIRLKTEEDMVYCKIPYASDYIFRAIFNILNRYKENANLPSAFTAFNSITWRDCFYKEQAYSYHIALGNEHDTIRSRLDDDLNSEKCTLGRRFEFKR